MGARFFCSNCGREFEMAGSIEWDADEGCEVFVMTGWIPCVCGQETPAGKTEFDFSPGDAPADEEGRSNEP